MFKTLRYFLEAVLLHFAFFIFWLMPVDVASATGGFLGRSIGTKLAASRKALKNIQRAFPDKTEDEHNIILRDMWDNLGRVMAEYPHLDKITRTRVTFENIQIADQARDDGQPGIFITAHTGNWEIAGGSSLIHAGIALDIVYRAPNNPWVDRLLNKIRTMNGEILTIPKSRTGVRQIMQSLKDGRHVGILIDQKYNAGIPASFFDHPAMTSTAFVDMAQKFKCPLIPVRIKRLEGAHFKITVEEPLQTFDAKGPPFPTEDVVNAAHKRLEGWITDEPGQWLWLHRRWVEDA